MTINQSLWLSTSSPTAKYTQLTRIKQKDNVHALNVLTDNLPIQSKFMAVH